MQTLAEIKALLESRGARPKRSLGQNFLIDQNLVRKLVDHAGVGGGDLVLEVGPGTGTLTEELLSRGCGVIACELDDVLAEMLTDRAGEMDGGERLLVINADCLENKRTLCAPLREKLADRPFSLVANLPYGAGTPLMMTLLLSYPQCRAMSVTIQREVAQRIGASSGTREYGGLSVIAQALCLVSRVAKLPPDCFWPRPDVTSSMLHLVRRDEPLTDDPIGLSETCRLLFAKRRKQLGSILDRGTTLPGGIDPRSRPEQLTVEQVIELHAGMRGG